MTAPAQAVVVAPTRPRTRGECVNGPRPCREFRCRYHLYVDTQGERRKDRSPALEDLAETCALDVADRGGATLHEVGRMLNLTRERIRQIEVRAVRKLRKVGRAQELAALFAGRDSRSVSEAGDEEG